MEPDIGIAKKKREAVADALVQTLADTYALYQKTHLYHWNVEGPRFGALHLLFETQYNELWTAIDLIAERVRALGVYAPSHADMAKRSTIAADNDPAPAADAMLRAMLSANEAVVKSAKSAIKAAEVADDPATADLMTERSAISEKAAWMLRAHLAE
ncbi:MAG: DNA starvation/stationary phase protection protein [Alphaproteobacteria bacterium]|nr:DNA starvation/stationary phase protection protein [Alphaproteobacteria bacterium]